MNRWAIVIRRLRRLLQQSLRRGRRPDRALIPRLPAATRVTIRWQSVEIPTNSERFRRPLGRLPRLSILAGREFKDEAAVDLI